MKKVLLFLILTTLLSGQAYAVTPTPTISATSAQEKINQSLQQEVASKVAQLKLVSKKGVIGTVTSINATQLVVTDLHGENQIIDVDELTKFSSPSAKSTFGISDITKGDEIGAIGLYNRDSRHLLARWVDELSLPKIFFGAILSIDKEAGTFNIATANIDEQKIDVEPITRTLFYTKSGGLLRSGFSKLTTGQRVIVVGFPDVKDSSLIVASRVVVFSELPANPVIPLVKPEDIAPVTPSTGSGKKITPLTHF